MRNNRIRNIFKGNKIINNNEISYQIARTFRRVNKSIMSKLKEEFSAFGITGPQGMLIGILMHNGELTVGEISKKMGLSISTVSGIIDRLEDNKFVERKRSKTDRRVVKVLLSSKCEKLVKSKHNIIESHLEKLIKCEDEEQLKKIMIGLETLESVINKNKEKENSK